MKYTAASLLGPLPSPFHLRCYFFDSFCTKHLVLLHATNVFVCRLVCQKLTRLDHHLTGRRTSAWCWGADIASPVLAFFHWCITCRYSSNNAAAQRRFSTAAGFAVKLLGEIPFADNVQTTSPDKVGNISTSTTPELVSGVRSDPNDPSDDLSRATVAGPGNDDCGFVLLNNSASNALYSHGGIAAEAEFDKYLCALRLETGDCSAIVHHFVTFVSFYTGLLLNVAEQDFCSSCRGTSFFIKIMYAVFFPFCSLFTWLVFQFTPPCPDFPSVILSSLSRHP